MVFRFLDQLNTGFVIIQPARSTTGNKTDEFERDEGSRVS